MRELRIQAGQKAKVLLLSLLHHHTTCPEMSVPSTGRPSNPPLPFPSEPLTHNTPPSPPTLSSYSGKPNSSTAGLSHQLYGSELPWCQLKELIRTAVCLCMREREREIEREGGWVVCYSEGEKVWMCAHSDTYLFIVISEQLAGKTVMLLYVYATRRRMICLTDLSLSSLS